MLIINKKYLIYFSLYTNICGTMNRPRYVAVILAVMLFVSSIYLNTIIPEELGDEGEKKFAPSSSWGFQSDTPTSGLSSSSSSTEQIGQSQTYSTSFTKSMDIESKHKEIDKYWPDQCMDWGYDFDSEIYVDYNLKIKHSGNTYVSSSANENDDIGDFTLTQTSVSSSYDVTVRPEIVFDYRLRMFETSNDCWSWFDEDVPDKIYEETLRIPIPSQNQEYSGQTSYYIPNLGSIYLWDSDASVPGINQPSSTTGFMLDERISVSTINVYPIFQKFFPTTTSRIDYWVDVEIPLTYNLDIEAQAQHAIEYVMSIDGGSFLDINDSRYVYTSPSQTDVMRLSSDPQRIFGSDLTNPGSTVSKQWVGDGEDVTITATPNLVYHIHAEVTGSISVSMIVYTSGVVTGGWLLLSMGPYSLWSGSTQTDSYSKVKTLGTAIEYTYSPPEPLFGITEFELFGDNVSPIAVVSGGSIIICLVILLSMLVVSRTSKRIQRHTNKMNSSLNSQRYGNIPSSPPPNLGAKTGNSLNWEEPFNPMNDQLLNSHNQDFKNSFTVGETQSIWDANLQQWSTIRFVRDYTQLPGGGNYVNDGQDTHYHASDGGDWLMLNDASFTLLPNKVNVNPIPDDVPNQINTEVNHSLNVAEDQSFTPFTVEWMEYPLATGNWWFRENSLADWSFWNPQDKHEVEPSTIESMEYPEGSGNWWDWNAVKGDWELLENHVSEGEISITSDILLGDHKEYPIGSGIWWSWDSENYVWQKIEQSLDLVEQDTNITNVHSTLNEVQPETEEMTDMMAIDDLIDDSENLINQDSAVSIAVQESNHICWSCVKPLSSGDWSFCPTCGARYHSSESNECNSQNLFNCINCAQSTSEFIQI